MKQQRVNYKHEEGQTTDSSITNKDLASARTKLVYIFEITRQPYEILKNEKEISYVVVNSYEQPTRSTSHGSKQQDDFHWKENAFPAKLRPEENVGAAGRRFRKRLASGDKPSRVPIASAFCTVIKRLHRRNSRYVVYASFNHRLSAPGRLGS